MTSTLSAALSRRAFLRSTAATGATLLLAPACGDYPAESGVAYAPWRFAESEDRPHLLAAGAALLAASPHNTQPWLFDVQPGRIDVFADPTKSLGAMDGLHREMHLGLGCAVENLLLTVETLGRNAELTWMPDPDDETHVARVVLSEGAARSSALADAIPFRHTNRGPYLDAPPPPSLEPTLRDVVRSDEATLVFLADAEAKATFRRQTVEATRAIVGDDEMNEASHAWYRHSRAAIVEHRDGTTLDATGNGSAIRFLGKTSARPSAAKAGGYWLDSTRGPQTTAAAYVILSTADRSDRTQQLRCGRAFQRIHLWAAAEGWALQPLNQMAERQDREQVLGLEPTFTQALRALSGGDGAQMLFRIGVPWEDAGPSPRRPLEWVTR
ncbi:MAG: hypothetical protein H6722_11530 [Sandaracinus sp.]|nr:hypothetical protein [Sandaracinus sp.]